MTVERAHNKGGSENFYDYRADPYIPAWSLLHNKCHGFTGFYIELNAVKTDEIMQFIILRDTSSKLRLYGIAPFFCEASIPS